MSLTSLNGSRFSRLCALFGTVMLFAGGTGFANQILPTSYSTYSASWGWNGPSQSAAYFDYVTVGTNGSTTLSSPPSGYYVPDWTGSVELATKNYDQYSAASQAMYLGWSNHADPTITFNFGQAVNIQSFSLSADNYPGPGVGTPGSVTLQVLDSTGNPITGDSAESALDWHVVNSDGSIQSTADSSNTSANHFAQIDGFDLAVGSGDAVRVTLTHSAEWTLLNQMNFNGEIVPTIDPIAAAPVPSGVWGGAALMAALGLLRARRSKSATA